MVPLCSEKFYLLLFWSRLVHADLAIHATLAALGTLPRSMSLWAPARPVGDMHASRVLWRSFQAVQSTAPGLQLHPSTHHAIVKQYRKGLTAVVDRCIYILESYPWYHSVPKSFIWCCSGLDLCMLTSRCMLPSLRSAPYPALCTLSPCARSATCKPCPMVLVPESTVHCSRSPARNPDLLSSDHAQGPWVGFTYIYTNIQAF